MHAYTNHVTTKQRCPIITGEMEIPVFSIMAFVRTQLLTVCREFHRLILYVHLLRFPAGFNIYFEIISISPKPDRFSSTFI